MKQPKMRLGITLLAMFILLVTSVHAEDKSPVTGTASFWAEGNTHRSDYSMFYYTLGNENWSVRIDDWKFASTTGFQRCWLNYGNLKIADTPSFKMSFQPGVLLVSTKDYWFYGGNFNYNMPKLGLSVVHKMFAGNKMDKMYIFTNLKLFKEKSMTCYLQHYYHNQGNFSFPDSYLGPKINFGRSASIYYGTGTSGNGSWAVNANASIKF